MGQAYSQPKVSGEVTLNRIRESCQRDDSVPESLRSFKVNLLANDLNSLGFNISTVDGKGHALSSEEVCRKIKEQAVPDVEEVCMMNASRKGEAMQTVEQMVKHFNKHYGARISILKNPLDPSKGKRSVASLCDDLYLVSDQLYRKLSDRPQVVKKQLYQEVDRLQAYKNQLEQSFNSTLVALAGQRGTDQDKLKDKLEVAKKLQGIVSHELARQLQAARQNYQTVASELKVEPSQLQEQLGFAVDKYRMARYGDDDKAKIAALLGIMKGMPPAVDSCTACIRKFGMGVDTYYTMSGDLQKLQPALMAKYIELMKETKDRGELRELKKCYERLLLEKDKCGRGSGLVHAIERAGRGTTGLGQFTDLKEAAAMVVSTFNASRLQPGRSAVGSLMVEREGVVPMTSSEVASVLRPTPVASSSTAAEGEATEAALEAVDVAVAKT